MPPLTVRLFARARDLAGVSAADLDPPPASVAGVRRALADRFPALAGLLAVSAVAVNAEFAGDDAAVRPGDEVAVIPPVSGG